MLSAVLVLLLVAAALGSVGWLVTQSRRADLAEVDRFSAARSMTTRWSQDPDSAPAPLRTRPARPASDEDAERID